MIFFQGIYYDFCFINIAEVVELVDTWDLKSYGPLGPCGFDPRPRYKFYEICNPINNYGPKYIPDLIQPEVTNSSIVNYE